MKLSRPGKINKFGLVIFGGFILLAVFADLISPYDPWVRFEPFQKPSWVHLLGTNDIGNDVFSELLQGARVSLAVGLGTAALATLLGLLVGLLSGYFGGLIDELLMGFTDTVLMVPRIPLVIIVAAFLKPGYGIIILVLGLVWWTSTARVIRAKTMQVRQSAFVIGNQTLGFSHPHIILTDIIPNIAYVLSPKFMLTVASAMISEASLSFLGLGDPTRKSWGMMIRFAFEKGGIINEMWWWYVPPGLFIVLCVLSIVLISFSFEREQTMVFGI